MGSMNETSVVIDILHYPHVNFYKHAIEILMGKNVNVHVILRPRGKLVSIFQKECPNVSFVLIGQHRNTIFGKMFDMVERDIAFLRYLSKIKFDAGTGFGSINLAHTTHFFGKPSIIFGDDIEYRLVYYLIKPFATRLVMPSSTSGKNLLKYSGFKELAYLHPNHFKPDINVLGLYNLDPYEYVFIREVSSATLNYRRMAVGQLSKILNYLKNQNLKIILSIEDKSQVDLFKDHCTILKEPIEDIHSLLHFAALTISSGDSIARESCLVGTPAIYTGGRDMSINNELIKRSCMFKVEDEKAIKETIKYLVDENIKKEVEAKINQAIKEEWVDTTEVILDVLLGTIYNDKSLIDKYKLEKY